MRAFLLVFVAAMGAPIAMAACGGVVAPEGGGGGKPEPTTTPTGTGTGTSPTSTGTTVPPGPPSCLETTEHVQISVVGGGHSDSCTSLGDRSPERAYDVVGQITATYPDHIHVDTCPPTADCTTDSTVDIHVGAPQLDLDLLPIGSFVDAHLTFAMPWACVTSVVIRSLDAWGGMKNPVDGGGHLYLEATDGTLTPTGDGLKVGTVAQHCKPTGAPGCSATTPDDYALQIFTGVGEVDGQLVHMGEARWPVFMPGGDTLRVYDVRSFQTDFCDDDWNWSFWAIRDVAMPD